MKTLLIGIGNDFRSDDGAGLAVARAVRGLAIAGVTVLEHSGEGASLIETWRGADCVIAVDAMQSSASPGSVTRFDVGRRALPVAAFRSSTHAFSLPQAIELARALNQLPHTFVVYGVEAGNFSAGTELSPEVQAGVRDAMRAILADLQEMSR